MDDLISREEALQTIADYQGGSVDKVVAKELLEALPAKQPTIVPVARVYFDKEQLQELVDKAVVHCRDCVYGTRLEFYGEPYLNCSCDEGLYRDVSDNNFCSNGIRREE